jgi:signal transduction histidine kinase
MQSLAAPRSQPWADTAAADAAILQERARIARELHDSVSQTLYAITLAATRARGRLDENDDQDARQMIEDVMRLASAGQAELRALLTNLHPHWLTSGGLAGGLLSLATDVRTRTGLDVRVSLGEEPEVPETTKEALLLISREALHNVVRHARADRVQLVLEVDAGELVLLITDDGRGFDPVGPRPGHFGLQSMRERAAAVGAKLEVVSADGVGTQMRVCVPRVTRPRSIRSIHDHARSAGR